MLGCIPVLVFAVNLARGSFEHWTALHDRCQQLESENEALTAQLNARGANKAEPEDRKPQKKHSAAHTRSRSEIAPTRPDLFQPHTSPEEIRKLASETMAFFNKAQMNEPTFIMSTTSNELTNRSLTESRQYQKEVLSEFVRQYSGRIFSVQEALRAEGIDTSRIDTLPARLVNTLAIKEAAFSLNGMAEQLENKRKASLSNNSKQCTTDAEENRPGFLSLTAVSSTRQSQR